MKVVINVCFGGFGLSMLAIKEYLKLKGKEAYFYENKDWSSGEYIRIDDIKECKDTIKFCYTKDLGKKFKYTKESQKFYIYDENIKRDDPDLVKVVEELGEKANGSYAELKVVEIPDGINWEIDEYDGNESIEEKHNSWS